MAMSPGDIMDFDSTDLHYWLARSKEINKRLRKEMRMISHIEINQEGSDYHVTYRRWFYLKRKMVLVQREGYVRELTGNKVFFHRDRPEELEPGKIETALTNYINWRSIQ